MAETRPPALLLVDRWPRYHVLLPPSAPRRPASSRKVAALWGAATFVVLALSATASPWTAMPIQSPGTALMKVERPRLPSRIPTLVDPTGADRSSISDVRPAIPVGTLPQAATVSILLANVNVQAANAAPNPDFFNFQPVCPASDGVFRVGQSMAMNIAGSETVEDYRPLINDVLIRVRTELCVLESFVRETATPFIAEKGLGWILPLQETSETYVAGVVFMVGANFILLGSTKVVAILAIYIDLIIGLPSRLLGSAFVTMGRGESLRIEQQMDRAMVKQSEEIRAVIQRGKGDIGAEMTRINAQYATMLEELREKKRLADESTSGMSRVQSTLRNAAVPLSIYGQVSLKLRQWLEIFDTFCSRYFVSFTVGYIIVKTLHYVVFPDLFADFVTGP